MQSMDARYVRTGLRGCRSHGGRVLRKLERFTLPRYTIACGFSSLRRGRNPPLTYRIKNDRTDRFGKWAIKNPHPRKGAGFACSNPPECQAVKPLARRARTDERRDDAPRVVSIRNGNRSFLT